MHRRFTQLLFGLCLAASLVAPLYAGSTIIPSSPDVHITVTSWLGNCPPNGFAPFQVEIKNRDRAAHTWDVTFRANNETELRRTFSVPAEGVATFDLMVQVCPSNRAGYYGSSNIFVTVHGFGVDGDHTSTALSNTSGFSGNQTPYVAMSHSLTVRHWGQLQESMKKWRSAGKELSGSDVPMDQAPTDWRGYMGIAELWLTEDDWNTLAAPVRAAIMEWVSLGGEVFMMVVPTEQPKVAWQYSRGQNGSELHGNGAFTKVPWDGTRFPFDSACTAIIDVQRRSSLGQTEDESSHFNFVNSMGQTKVRAGLVFGFILIFGVIIGPINLLWFARPPRRHRLFWTTPALSLGGSLLLIALIILQDGLGGAGVRTVAVLLLPEDKKIAVFQEQVTRTGVLLSQNFPVRETNWMFPFDIKGKNPYDNSIPNSFLAENAKERTGSWFTSRSIVGHGLQTIRPSRGSIQFSAGPSSSASIVSSISVPLKTIFIIDDDGKVWTTENAGTGEKKVLTASDKETLHKWLTAIWSNSGSFVNSAIYSRYDLKGTVFAEAAEVGDFPIESLPSIRWNKQKVFFTGPLTHL